VRNDSCQPQRVADDAGELVIEPALTQKTDGANQFAAVQHAVRDRSRGDIFHHHQPRRARGIGGEKRLAAVAIRIIVHSDPPMSDRRGRHPDDDGADQWSDPGR
jgi:hypothetical protein